MYKRLTVVGFVIALLISSLPCRAAQGELIYRGDHVLVRYNGIEAEQAEAIARVVEAARGEAVGGYVFDMPETVYITINCGPGNKVRLFNDGQDRMDLSLRSADQLKPPGESGIFHLYGLCHEVGHLAMCRTIQDHGWLNHAGAEGWAHYLGSVLVDRLYETEGESVWCYPYDYRPDGTARLDAQLGQDDPNDTASAAGLWRELVGLIGPDQVAPLFESWDEAEVDPADPGAALRRVLLEINEDERVADWWNRAEPVMIHKQPKSGFAARTAKPTQLMRQPSVLALDDGKATGKRSIAGGGHAVTFDAPGPGWYLTQVRIFGSRYGRPQPPDEDFSVWLCDEQGEVVREYKFPYSTFRRGNPQWVALRIEPTETPTRFMICAGFNPTGTKGVYVHHDGEAGDTDTGDEGRSRVGLPGRMGDPMSEGDWLIRVVIDQREDADALHE